MSRPKFLKVSIPGASTMIPRAEVPPPHERYIELIKNSEHFNEDFYLRKNKEAIANGTEPALHYLLQGGLEGLDPSPSFSTSAYLLLNPDVREAGVNALLHYELCGRMEGRNTQRAGVSFLHVPKSAGHSMVNALSAALKPTCIQGGFDHSLFGDFDNFCSIDEEIRNVIFPDEFRPDADLVYGHMALSTLLQRYPSHCRVTVFREPRCYLLSLWLFWRGHSDEELASWGEWGQRLKIARASLLEFLTAPEVASCTDNVITRMLLWPHDSVPASGFIPAKADRELLDACRHSLDAFDFVGVLEESDLPARLGRFLGVRIALQCLHATAVSHSGLRPILADEFARPAIAAMHDRSRLDSVLWGEVLPEYFSRGDLPEVIADSVLLREIFKYIKTGLAADNDVGRDPQQNKR